MAAKIRGSYLSTPQEQVVNDAFLNNIRIQNIRRNDKEHAPVWKAQQKMLYPNSLEIFPTKPLEQIIQDEAIESLSDYSIQHEKAKYHLMKITDAKTADYILDRLSIEELVYLNQSYIKIVDDIKIRGKFDKDVFIAYIRNTKDDAVKNSVDNMSIMNGTVQSFAPEPTTQDGKERLAVENQKLKDQQAAILKRNQNDNKI